MTGNVAIRSLGEIAKIGAGNSAPQGEHLFDGGQHPFFRTSDVGRIRFGEISTSVDCLNEVGIRGLRLFPRGTILFPKSGASTFLNHRVMLDADGYVSSHLATIIADEAKVLPRFLLYFLSTVAAQDLVQDHAYPSLNLPVIAGIPVPVPILREQQRIVGILDEAFASMVTAKANAEKNLQNARAIFESYLQSTFTKRGPGWEEKRLGDVVTRLTNGFVGPTRNIYYDSGVPYLLARHVKNNRLAFDGRTFISDEFNRKNKKSMLKAGDVLLVQSGHIGHSAVVTKEHEGHNCHAMIVITPVKGAFIGSFLSLFFSSSGMKKKFQEIRSGSTVPHLTCGEVKELAIALPDLATQQRLVDHSWELEVETQRLESLYQRKLTALDELKQSLLHQAFSGQL